jgi:hypothetical protein
LNSRSATLGDVGIGGGQEVGQGFEDGDLGAQALPHAAHLQADHAGADHAEALRGVFEIEHADVVDDVLAVELGERQLDRGRTRGEDHVGAFSSTSLPSCALTLTTLPACSVPKPWKAVTLLALNSWRRRR